MASVRPPMRVIPVRRPSRARYVLLGLMWLTIGSAAVTYLVKRPTNALAHSP